MRLTLRTLLAYLDDRLSSANAREIGRKLKESPFAQDLADRIRTVMRQRRLTAPGRKVKMIDPNLIAEYLDDQLTPELVSLIEKEVLSSDFSLAEVAASHQIIGLLGDPVELDDGLRERLRKQSPYRSEEESTDHEMEQMAEKKLSDPSQEVWNPMAKQRTFSPRSPALILAALLVGWLVLLLTEPMFRSGKNDPATARNEALAAAAAENEQDAPPAADDADAAVEAGDGEENSDVDGASAADARSGDQNAAGQRNPDAETSQTAPAGASSPEPEDETVMTNDTQVASTDSPATPPSPPVASTPSDESSDDNADAAADADSASDSDDSGSDDSDSGNDEDAAVAAVPLEPRVFDYVVDDPGRLLLSRPVAGGEWVRTSVVQGDFPDWHDVLTDRVSALPEPFTAEVSPVDSGWRATFVSPCLFRFDDGVLPQLRLIDGRCIITRNQLNDLDGAGGFDLIAGGATVRCLPDGEDLRLGIWTVPVDAVDVPEGSDEAVSEEHLPLANDASVTLFVAGGSVRLQPADGEPVVLGKGRAVQWTTSAGQAENATFSEPTMLDAVPDWVHTATAPAIPEVEELKGRLTQAFEKGGAPLDAARQLCSGRNPLMARYAASVLSVVRAGDVLVQVLLQTEEEQVRIEAIYGIRQAAGQSVAGWKTISRALENRLPERDLDDFVALLRGLTPAEAEDEATSLWMVSMLNHERAAIRQLAFLNLVELTGERHNYHPDSDRSARSEAVRRWSRWLKRNNNRLRTPE